MKITHKAALLVTLFCMVCASAGAQIAFNSWGRAVITPVAFSGDHSSVSAATSTWGDVPSIGFSANGTSPSGNIGFNLDFNFGIDITRSNSIAIIGDNAKAWVKPLGLVLPEEYNMLKLTAGWFKEDELRGKIGASEFASWLIYRQVRTGVLNINGDNRSYSFIEWPSPNEDTIFQRFDATAGAHFRLEPLKWWDSPWNGLNIQGAFGSNALGTSSNSLRATLNLGNNEDFYDTAAPYEEGKPGYDGERMMSADNVYKAMQVALAYRIPKTGLFRVQYIGNNREVLRRTNMGASWIDAEKKLMTGLAGNKDADILEVAFLYDGLEGLIVDLGVKIPFEYSIKTDFLVYPLALGVPSSAQKNNGLHHDYTVQFPYAAAMGLSWMPSFLPELNLTARVDATFGGSIKSDVDKIAVKPGMILDVWLMPSFNVSRNIKLGVDMAVDIHEVDSFKENNKPVDSAITDASEYIDYGIGPWFELAVGGGRVRTGLIVMIPGSPRYKYNGSTVYYTYSQILTGDPVISVPVSFTYTF